MHNISDSFYTDNTSEAYDSPDIWVMSVFEHQRLQASDFRYRSDFAWLLAQEFDVFSIKRHRGQWQLKVGHYIGIIVLPSTITLEILPKTLASAIENQHSNQPYELKDAITQTRQWVQQMLSDLLNAHNHTGSKFPHHKNIGQVSTQLTPLPLASAPLSEWLVQQFLHLLAVYQPTPQYQTQTQNQATLQGKLLIKQQLRQNSHQPHKFVSEISTLSLQNPANRLIKSALTLIAPLLQPQSYAHLSVWQQIKNFSPDELRQLDSLYLMATRQLQTQPAMPQLQAASQLLAWAYGLLQWQQSSLQTGQGLHPQETAAATTLLPRLCLLINMNHAFEQWATGRIVALFSAMNASTMNVSAMNTEHNHTRYQSHIQPRAVWLRDSDGQSRLSIQPDLVIYQSTIENTIKSTVNSHLNSPSNSRLNHTAANSSQPVSQLYHCSHVIDIKWKPSAQSGAISASDAYQLSSYAQAYQAQQVWLVYPVTDALRQPMVLTPQNRAAASDKNNDKTDDKNSPAELWLMPFNVFTGKLNNDLQPSS